MRHDAIEAPDDADRRAIAPDVERGHEREGGLGSARRARDGGIVDALLRVGEPGRVDGDTTDDADDATDDGAVERSGGAAAEVCDRAAPARPADDQAGDRSMPAPIQGTMRRVPMLPKPGPTLPCAMWTIGEARTKPT